MTMPDAVPLLLVGAKLLLAVAGVVFLLSGLDDAFIDACFLVMRLRRRGPFAEHAVPSERMLMAKPEAAIAVLVPAWDEATVIRRMVDNMLSSVRYANYHVFVGTYPNDPATQREVAAVMAAYPNVHRVVCPNAGPTCKSDCLNWIYQAVLEFERRTTTRFELFVLHDAEDLPHPQSFKLFNALVPGYDMVQLPVFCFPPQARRFTAGHYLDEFAESHGKDLPVRQWLTGTVPAAGVGCAFSRRALRTLAKSADNQVFSLDSLTEDYEIGMRLQRHGLRQTFVMADAGGGEYVGTWEHFPSRLSRAVRQKSRWLIGIALQGWASLGWQGNGWTRYALFRDRKALLTNHVVMAGYVAVALVASLWIAATLVPDSYQYPPLVQRGSWLWYLMWANAGFMALRLVQRALWVRRFYGWRQALLALPRQVWSNVVNGAATNRAVRLYIRHRITGRPIAWDKTGHVFPSDAELRRHHKLVDIAAPQPRSEVA